MTYLPLDDYYEIPAGALQSKDFENLFFAGRGIAAENKAIASARVIGTCLGTGFAAGWLAAGQSRGVDRQTSVLELRRECGLDAPQKVLPRPQDHESL